MRVDLLILAFFLSISLSQAQSIRILQEGKETSLRGLSVCSDSVAWISGSKGWTASTRDRGKSWNWKQLKGYENLDFRDIEGFNANEAIIVSAGSPAVILLTVDGGNSWKEVYRNEASEIFLDGMDFWDRNQGMIYGDPINSKMVLLRTQDGGKSWADISSNNPVTMKEGEAGFAASGTGIRTLKNGLVFIASGGSQSRLFKSQDYGNSWTVFGIPIIQGKSSTGPFSISFLNRRRGIAAGGDYLKDTLRTDNLLITRDGGQTWRHPKMSTWGYRSAVTYISKKKALAAGTSGVDLSSNGGKTWTNISQNGFHTVMRSKTGNWILLTGNKGLVAEYSP